MNDLLINTAAIAAELKIDGDLLNQWGHGCVELYSTVGEWAAIVTEEEAHLDKVLRDDGFPGVFAYEVSENLGCQLRLDILNGTDITDDKVRSMTKGFVTDFIKRGYRDDQLKANAIVTAYLAA